MGGPVIPFEVGGTWLSEFSRASVGTYIGADGLLHTAAVNVPRADYSNGFAELLLEQAATNYIMTGQNGFNVFAACSITENSAIAPDGTLTAATAVSTGAGTEFATTSNTGANFPAPNNAVASIWLKAAAPVTITVQMVGGGAEIVYSEAWNLTTSWQRFYIAGYQPSGTNSIFLVMFPPAGSTVYGWGFQVEVGLVPTSLIITASGPTSRAADIAYVIATPQQGNLPAVPQRSAEQVLAYLLSIDPDGAVFPDLTSPNAVWPLWLAPLAAEIARFEGLAVEMLPESDPGEATYLLADYQRVLGPDPYGRDLVALTLADQRALAFSRWTEKFGVRPADFIAFAATFGVVITIQEYALTTAGAFAGVDLVGHPTEFAWLVHLPAVAVEIAEASAASAGDLLGSYQPSLAQGAIAGRAPAHTNPYFTYS